MNIILRKLSLKNFKGIKELDINFGKSTTIAGGNATGKTTVFDGFCWLLFGKDSKGRSTFEVQTLDGNNNVIHGVDCNVAAEIEVDGVVKTFSRTLSEKWVKQRGQAESELKGCTTNFEINGVPIKQKEYLGEINDLVNEDLFKMLTNPLHFPSMKWQEQRKILLDIIGDIEDESVINYNASLSPLRDELKDSIDSFNKRTKASISKLKESVKSLPYRIDECNNSIVEVDTETLEFQKRNINAAIGSIDEQIADSSKANEGKLNLQDKLYELKKKESELQLAAIKEKGKPVEEIISKINAKQDTLQVLEQTINNNTFKIKGNLNLMDHFIQEIKIKEDRQKALREEWTKLNSEIFEFDDTKTICPCCARAYEADKIEEIKSNALDVFNKNKNNTLSDIQSKGKSLSVEINGFKEKLPELQEVFNNLEVITSDYETKKSLLKSEIEELEKQKEELSQTTEINIPGLYEIQKEIAQIQADIETFITNDNTELKNKKKCLQEELEIINKQINTKDNNKKLLIRIEELKQEEKDLNIKIAELEGQQYLGEEFIKTKVELLEGGINKKFNGAVTFKLFNQQVNGGVVECCEALVGGVPFGNANTAGQINAGLSIINTLCDHYEVQAPIFVDNRESVNDLVGIDKQIINLIVSKDKKLKIVKED